MEFRDIVGLVLVEDSRMVDSVDKSDEGELIHPYCLGWRLSIVTFSEWEYVGQASMDM